jgi:regulator of sigma D
MERELNEIQSILNKTLNETKTHWSDLKSYTSQLQKIEDKTDNVEMGGIKISELNESMSTLTKFLEGAFQEVNKSVQNLNTELEESKKNINKDSQ